MARVSSSSPFSKVVQSPLPNLHPAPLAFHLPNGQKSQAASLTAGKSLAIFFSESCVVVTILCAERMSIMFGPLCSPIGEMR